MTLLVAATERELCGLEGLVCGIGPVEAAAATARALAQVRPNAVLHVGIAGGRGIAPPTLVLGSEAVYEDLSGDRDATMGRAERLEPDARLLAAARGELPGRSCYRSGRRRRWAPERSARSRRWRVSPSCAPRSLQACPRSSCARSRTTLAERDRARWDFDGALAALDAALPGLLVGARVSGSSLPPPLPPETRTVGQLVAESIRLYGNHFWRVLPLGLALAGIDQVSAGRPTGSQALILLACSPVLSLAYLLACLIAHETEWTRGTFWRALGAGTLAFLPVPFLVLVFVLPGLAWLALVGLVVPAILYEDLSVRAGFARALRLARADYVHALGSLATLVIVV